MKICVFTVSGCDKFCNFGNFPGKYAFQTVGGLKGMFSLKIVKLFFAQIWNIAKKKIRKHVFFKKKSAGK